MDITTIYILLIIFLATLIRSTLGFGEAMIAVPLLVLVIPIEIAVPLSALASITVAAVIVVQDRQHIHIKSAKWLIIFAILGIPLGLFILIHGNERFTKLGLGLLILLYSTFSLIGKRTIHLEKDNMLWLFICGFSAGVLGGAYGINGPPLVIYGNMRKWSAKHFRATLQGYFLPMGIISMFAYWYKGVWGHEVTYYYLITLPVVIPTIFLGRYLNHRLKDGAFFKYVCMGLIIIGTLLITQSLMKK